MGWFVALMEELGITYHVGHPAKIRTAETRRQKHDRRDAALLLELLAEHRFPSIWMPSTELRNLRALLRHRDEWVRIRTRVRNALQSVALAHGIRRRAGLWSRAGHAVLTSLPLAPHAADRRSELQTLHAELTTHIATWISVSARRRANGPGLPSYDASGRRPHNGPCDGSIPGGSGPLCGCEGARQLCRDDSE